MNTGLVSRRVIVTFCCSGEVCGDVLALPTATGGVVFSLEASRTAGPSPIASDIPFSRARAMALRGMGEHSEPCREVGQVLQVALGWGACQVLQVVLGWGCVLT